MQGRLAVLATVIAGEAIGAGLGTTAFVAYMAHHPSSLYRHPAGAIHQPDGGAADLHQCDLRLAGGVAGLEQLFWLCFVLAFPGMLLLIKAAPWN